MYSIVNQGAKREYSWATRPMSNEEWRWKAPDLSVSYNCPSTYQANNNFIILSVPLFAPDIVEKPRRI